MIKNCIFKSKLEHFLERVYKRLLEKAFDKIKENNWVLEERKEILEAIINRRNLKLTFILWTRRNRIYNSLSGLISNF